MEKYDVIVVGAGHAGIEAACASSSLGLRTLILTLNSGNIGLMSCNPAIGGVGKGQLVKEIDALGGQMAKAADTCAIQYRILNASKGCAVRSSRAQIDKSSYTSYMRRLLNNRKKLTVKQGIVGRLIIQDMNVRGVLLESGEKIQGTCVIICAGTFLNGKIHIGLNCASGGRINEPASIALEEDLTKCGFALLRFKTGTCPRIDRSSIDFSKLAVQKGDTKPMPFSFSTKKILRRQVPCHITYTNELTHKIIRQNLDRSPLYTGIIKATGVRYCPSIEDKILRFADKIRHQVFLEPEGIGCPEVYPNGLSQLEMLRSIAGLENARILRFGYGIEHTVIKPTQLYPTLETKLVRNLYTAGQINGTTGYEEAAAQGLIAGINAALRVKNLKPLILERSSGYIGVLIDDLTTKGTNEPYRMFTSRVEYRLILREDNADARLSRIGYNIGLVSKQEYYKSVNKTGAIEKSIALLKKTRINPHPKINNVLEKLNTSPIKRPMTLEELLKRPQIRLAELKKLSAAIKGIKFSIFSQVENEVKYAGFIQRQIKEVEKFQHLEKIKLPPGLDYGVMKALSREIREKLSAFKPLNLGQASRISGITPAAISLLMVYLKKTHGKDGDEKGKE
jgi:tRNA uridine 5-carboxymethylaminomethyl modification enzyme